jgi:hypothetical protein
VRNSCFLQETQRKEEELRTQIRIKEQELNDYIAHTREETQKQTAVREQLIRESQEKDNRILQKDQEINQQQVRFREESEKQTNRQTYRMN